MNPCDGLRRPTGFRIRTLQPLGYASMFRSEIVLCHRFGKCARENCENAAEEYFPPEILRTWVFQRLWKI